MDTDLSRIERMLATFDEASNGDCPWAFTHRGGEFPLHVVVGAAVHGNEIGTLPAVVDLVIGLARGQIEFGGDLTVIIGNPEATLAGRRFIDADLNRSFGSNQAGPGDANSHGGRETLRAAELTPILTTADVFIDLHQTNGPTDRAFYIGPFRNDLWKWASALAGATTWVTRPPNATFSTEGMCADEFVRDLGRPGLTLEVGQAGFNTASDACTRSVLARLLDVASEVGRSATAVPGDPSRHPQLSFVSMTWAQAFDDQRLRLRDGITNFAPVAAGDLLSAPSSPSIIAPSDGLLLFPKYLDYDENGLLISPRPGEIVRIVAPLEEHPATLWG